MWGNKPDQKPSAAAEPAQPVAAERPAAPVVAPSSGRTEASRFAPSLSVKGEISGREDLFIDGRMDGSIRLPESRVTVGPNGRVAAEVEAAEIVVEGQVRGNLRARSRVELRSGCRVRGDLTTERLTIHEGARFNGKVEMVKPGQPVSGASRGAAASVARSETAAPILAKDSSE